MTGKPLTALEGIEHLEITYNPWVAGYYGFILIMKWEQVGLEYSYL